MPLVAHGRVSTRVVVIEEEVGVHSSSIVVSSYFLQTTAKVENYEKRKKQQFYIYGK